MSSPAYFAQDHKLPHSRILRTQGIQGAGHDGNLPLGDDIRHTG